MNPTSEERLDAIRGEINACKSLLRDTDYSLYKLVENIADCETFEEVKAAFADYLASYGATVEKRREWRRRINEAEAEAEAIERSLRSRRSRMTA